MFNRMINLLKRLFNEKLSHENTFSSLNYQRHNERRLSHLASLNLALKGKSVLEVGAGVGDHTSFFIERNCNITTSDAREDNLALLSQRYPDIQALRLDLDNPPDDFRGIYEIIYCYGLLYHLKKPLKAIEFLSRHCSSLLLLETCVSFGTEEAENFCSEDRHNPTQSYSGTGCRPTRNWIFHRLEERFEHVYMPVTQPDHEEFPLDWTARPASQLLSRSIFIASRERLMNNLLLTYIPMRQFVETHKMDDNH